MLTIHYSGRKITIQPDTYEELEVLKGIIARMESEGDIKVYDKGDFVVVFVTTRELQVLEIITEIKIMVEKII